DDLAVDGRVLRAHDDVVALEDSDVLHGLAADAQDVLALLTARDRRHLDVVLDVLLGEDRLARGDLADERQPGTHEAADVPRHGLDRAADIATDAVEQLDRARL